MTVCICALVASVQRVRNDNNIWMSGCCQTDVKSFGKCQIPSGTVSHSEGPPDKQTFAELHPYIPPQYFLPSQYFQYIPPQFFQYITNWARDSRTPDSWALGPKWLGPNYPSLTRTGECCEWCCDIGLSLPACCGSLMIHQDVNSSRRGKSKTIQPTNETNSPSFVFFW